MHEHRWRYKIETFKPGRARDFETRDSIIQEKLNRLGSEGWECFEYSQVGAYVHLALKRRH